jgi:hypothetical protein
MKYIEKKIVLILIFIILLFSNLNNKIKSGILNYLTITNTELGYGSGFAPINNQYPKNSILNSINKKRIKKNETD